MTMAILSACEKATKLNRLMKLKYSATPCEGKTNILGLLENYNKKTNIIIDHMIFKLYGLHYKSFIDTQLGTCGVCSWDPIKLEKAIDHRINFFEKELDFNLTCRKCSNLEIPNCVTFYNTGSQIPYRPIPICFDCNEAAKDEFYDLVNSDKDFEEQWQDGFEEWVTDVWLPE